jgi:hypothetical protein
MISPFNAEPSHVTVKVIVMGEQRDNLMVSERISMEALRKEMSTHLNGRSFASSLRPLGTKLVMVAAGKEIRREEENFYRKEK